MCQLGGFALSTGLAGSPRTPPTPLGISACCKPFSQNLSAGNTHATCSHKWIGPSPPVRLGLNCLGPLDVFVPWSSLGRGSCLAGTNAASEPGRLSGTCRTPCVAKDWRCAMPKRRQSAHILALHHAVHKNNMQCCASSFSQ
jgi:hypothetical protein